MPAVHLTIDRFLSSGRVWDVYRGHLSTGLSVVLKVASSEPSYYRPNGMARARPDDIEQVAEREKDVYTLPGLPGGITPRWLGEYKGRLTVNGTRLRGNEWAIQCDVIVMVMEDVGDERSIEELQR